MQTESLKKTQYLCNKLDNLYKSQAKINFIYSNQVIELREKLKEVGIGLLYNSAFDDFKNVEIVIWKKVFYEPIQFMKRDLKKFSNIVSDEVQITIPSPYLYFLKGYICSGIGYYHQILSILQIELLNNNLNGRIDFELQDDFNLLLKNDDYINHLEISEATKSNMIAHQTLIYLGDLARYLSNIEGDEKIGFNLAQRYYHQAILLAPNLGMPHSQLGTLFNNKFQGLCSIFYYVTCTMSNQSFEGAHSNLKRVFDRVRPIYNKMTRLEDSNNTADYQDGDEEVGDELKHVDVSSLMIHFIHLLDLFYNEDLKADALAIQSQCQVVLALFTKILAELHDGPTTDKELVTNNTAVTIPNVQSQPEDKENRTALDNFFDSPVILQMAALCFMIITILQNTGSKHLNLAVAFTIGFCTYILNKTVCDLQSGIRHVINNAKQPKNLINLHETDKFIEGYGDGGMKSMAKSFEHRLTLSNNNVPDDLQGGSSLVEFSTVKQTKNINKNRSLNDVTINCDSSNNQITCKKNSYKKRNAEPEEHVEGLVRNNLPPEFSSKIHSSSLSNGSLIPGRNNRRRRRRRHGRRIKRSEVLGTQSTGTTCDDTDTDEKDHLVLMSDTPSSTSITQRSTQDSDDYEKDDNSIDDDNDTFDSQNEFYFELEEGKFVTEKFSETGDSSPIELTQSQTIHDIKEQNSRRPNAHQEIIEALVTQVVNRERLLSVVKVFCNWLESHNEILFLCSKGCQAMWASFVNLLNSLPNENHLKNLESFRNLQADLYLNNHCASSSPYKATESDGGCFKPIKPASFEFEETGYKTHQEGEANDGDVDFFDDFARKFCGDKKNFLCLTEDVYLFGFMPLRGAQSHMLYLPTAYLTLNPEHQTLIRILQLRRFGRFLSETKEIDVLYDEDTDQYFNSFTIAEKEMRSQTIKAMVAAKNPKTAAISTSVNQDFYENRNISPSFDGAGKKKKLLLSESELKKREELMRLMGHLRLQCESNMVASTSSPENIDSYHTNLGGKSASPFSAHHQIAPPYLVPDTHVLCEKLHLIKILLHTHSFIIILSRSVLDLLDILKKESSKARRVIRWVEAELREGNKFLHVQYENEQYFDFQFGRAFDDRDKKIRLLCDMVRCAKYFAQKSDLPLEDNPSISETTTNHTVGRIVSLILTYELPRGIADRFSRPYLVKQFDGLNMMDINDFYDNWKRYNGSVMPTSTFIDWKEFCLIKLPACSDGGSGDGRLRNKGASQEDGKRHRHRRFTTKQQRHRPIESRDTHRPFSPPFLKGGKGGVTTTLHSSFLGVSGGSRPETDSINKYGAKNAPLSSKESIHVSGNNGGVRRHYAFILKSRSPLPHSKTNYETVDQTFTTFSSDLIKKERDDNSNLLESTNSTRGSVINNSDVSFKSAGGPRNDGTDVTFKEIDFVLNNSAIGGTFQSRFSKLRRGGLPIAPSGSRLSRIKREKKLVGSKRHYQIDEHGGGHQSV